MSITGVSRSVSQMTFRWRGQRVQPATEDLPLANSDHMPNSVGPTVDAMNQLLGLVYVVGGGAVGAGLNQYLTNIGQRRTARAAVVGKVSEAEALFAQIMWPGPSMGNGVVGDLYAQMERCLHELEGAGLIAGVPRSVLSSYILICRSSCALKRAKSLAASMDDSSVRRLKAKLLAFARARAADLRSDQEIADFATEGPRRIDTLYETWRNVLRATESFEADLPNYHDATLDRLRACLWHPIISKTAWRKQRKLRETNEKIEETQRELLTSIRKNQATTTHLVEVINALPMS